MRRTVARANAHGLAADQHTALIVAVTGPCKDRGDVLPLILTSPSARAWLSVRGHYLEVWRCHPAVGGGIEVQRQPVRRESLGRPDQRPLPAGALSWQGG